MLSYCLIATAIGPVGIAWSETGIVRLQLPDSDGASTKARLLRKLPEHEEGDPPDMLQDTVRALQRYFSGTPTELSFAPLDLKGVPEFHASLYMEMLKLGWGETVTYGGLAERVNAPGAAQAIGQAMGKNPIPVIVPCHRVLASGNKLGGFSAPGGGKTKLKLLAMEGVRLGFTDPKQMAFTF